MHCQVFSVSMKYEKKVYKGMNDEAVIFDMVLPFCLLGGTVKIVHAKTHNLIIGTKHVSFN